jgi:ABC-type molybdate transport system substrate-binding protein
VLSIQPIGGLIGHKKAQGGTTSRCIQNAPLTRLLAATAFLSVAFLDAPTAQAAELQVQVTIALRVAVGEMAAAFEKRSGHTIKITVAAPGEIVAALQAGRHADVVVLTDGGLAELEDKGLVRRERVALASSAFGFATRSGGGAPDISTPDALRAVLMEASKVIYNDPKTTPSGQVLLRIAERLGVAEQVKAKSAGRRWRDQREHAGQGYKPRIGGRHESPDRESRPSGNQAAWTAAEGTASTDLLFGRAGCASPG